MTQTDDFLQGILFSRGDGLDLRLMTDAQRRFYRLAAVRTRATNVASPMELLVLPLKDGQTNSGSASAEQLALRLRTNR